MFVVSSELISLEQFYFYTGVYKYTHTHIAHSAHISKCASPYRKMSICAVPCRVVLCINLSNAITLAVNTIYRRYGVPEELIQYVKLFDSIINCRVLEIASGFRELSVSAAKALALALALALFSIVFVRLFYL